MALLNLHCPAPCGPLCSMRANKLWQLEALDVDGTNDVSDFCYHGKVSRPKTKNMVFHSFSPSVLHNNFTCSMCCRQHVWTLPPGMPKQPLPSSSVVRTRPLNLQSTTDLDCKRGHCCVNSQWASHQRSFTTGLWHTTCILQGRSKDFFCSSGLAGLSFMFLRTALPHGHSAQKAKLWAGNPCILRGPKRRGTIFSTSCRDSLS